MTPEQEARSEIDRLLVAAGWSVQQRDQDNITAAQGVAICEYPLKKGHGFANYLLYADGAAVGVIEAKKMGIPLTAVEIQTAKYGEGLPDHIPAPRRPLPFCYQSSGAETRFTNLLEPEARSRSVLQTLADFSFTIRLKALTRHGVYRWHTGQQPITTKVIWEACREAATRAGLAVCGKNMNPE